MPASGFGTAASLAVLLAYTANLNAPLPNVPTVCKEPAADVVFISIALGTIPLETVPSTLPVINALS